MFAIEPDLSAIRWIGSVADKEPAYGSGMLDIGAPLPRLLSSAPADCRPFIIV
jgi:hypothetical protein